MRIRILRKFTQVSKYTLRFLSTSSFASCWCFTSMFRFLKANPLPIPYKNLMHEYVSIEHVKDFRHDKSNVLTRMELRRGDPGWHEEAVPRRRDRRKLRAGRPQVGAFIRPRAGRASSPCVVRGTCFGRGRCGVCTCECVHNYTSHQFWPRSKTKEWHAERSVYIYMHIHTYTYIYVHIHTYTYILIHTHI